MTLEEAIKHCEEVAESKKKQVENGEWEKGSPTERDCLECASEHRQLAEWLKELKQYREWLKSFNPDSATDCFTAVRQLRSVVRL
jgi:hypothetical protein